MNIINDDQLLRLDCSIDDCNDSQIVFIDLNRNFRGTICLQYENRKSANISKLFVSPEYRRRGIATKLLNECCKIARESGCETISLMCLENNKEIIKLYKANSFAFTYQYDDGYILMTKFLNKHRSKIEDELLKQTWWYG